MTYAILWLLILLANILVWWRAGYASGRLDGVRVMTYALKHGYARCELQHGTSVQRGYVMAHTDLLKVEASLQRPKWWHAFRRPRPELHLPDIGPAARVDSRLS